MTPFATKEMKEMMNRRLQVAVSVEHSRGWGCRVCEGVCSYAQTHPDWRITMFDGVLPSVAVSGVGKIVVANTGVVRYLWRDGEPTFSGRYSDGFVTGGGTLRVRKSSREVGFRLLVK